MHRKGDLAVKVYGDGDVDKTIAYYQSRIEETKKELPLEPDRNNTNWWFWKLKSNKLDKKVGYFEKMITSLEKRKRQRASGDLVHAKSSMLPRWREANRDLPYRFFDHTVVMSQRPRGTRGPAYESQLLAVSVCHNPSTEREAKDRARSVAALKEFAASDKSPFRVALCSRDVEYMGVQAQMFILAGTDVNLAFVTQDLPAIVLLYNKHRGDSNVKLL